MISWFRRTPPDRGKIITLENTQPHQVEHMTSWCSDNIGTGGWIGGASSHVTPKIYNWSVFTCLDAVMFSFNKTSDGDKFTLHFGVEE